MAGISQIVLDASVLIKWYLLEDFSDLAQQIKDNFLIGTVDIIVPDLIFYEISNVLRYKPNFSIQDLDTCIYSLYGLQLNIYHWNVSFGQLTINLAYKYGITVYDASYLATAQLCNCILITCDEKFLKKIENEKYVLHLKDLNSLTFTNV